MNTNIFNVFTPFLPTQERPARKLLSQKILFSGLCFLILLANAWLGLALSPLSRHASILLVLSVTSLLQFTLGIPQYFGLLRDFHRHVSRLPLMLTSLITYGVGLWLWITAQAGLVEFQLSALTILMTALVDFYERKLIFKAIATEDPFEDHPPKVSLKQSRSAFEEVATASLVKGDVIKVPAGEIIPLDGVILSGTTSVDESALVGICKPLLKEKGDAVVGASINRDSDIIIEITESLQNNVSVEMQSTLKNNQANSLTFYHKALQSSQTAVFLGVVVALCSCFYAYTIKAWPFLVTLRLGLGTFLCFSFYPLASSALWLGHGLLKQAFEQGVLIKESRFLDILAHLNVLFFHKTGTLTRGHYEYAQSFIELGTNQGKFLSTFFSLQKAAGHEFGDAVEYHPWYNEIPKHSVSDLKMHPGLGICGTIHPKSQKPYFAAVGSLRFLKRQQFQISRDMKAKMDELEATGETVLLCGYDKHIHGMISFADTIRPGTRPTLKLIQEQGIEVAIVTGDSEEGIVDLTKSMGIQKVYSRSTPEEKATKVSKEVNQGHTVGIVGDCDDKLAFEKAHVSVSIGTGSHIKNQNADILLMNENLYTLGWLIQNTRSIYKRTQHQLITGLCLTGLSLVGVFSGWLRPEMLSVLSLLYPVFLYRSIQTAVDSTPLASYHQDFEPKEQVKTPAA